MNHMSHTKEKKENSEQSVKIISPKSDSPINVQNPINLDHSNSDLVPSKEECNSQDLSTDSCRFNIPKKQLKLYQNTNKIAEIEKFNLKSRKGSNQLTTSEDDLSEISEQHEKNSQQLPSEIPDYENFKKGLPDIDIDIEKDSCQIDTAFQIDSFLKTSNSNLEDTKKNHHENSKNLIESEGKNHHKLFIGGIPPNMNRIRLKDIFIEALRMNDCPLLTLVNISCFSGFGFAIVKHISTENVQILLSKIKLHYQGRTLELKIAIDKRNESKTSGSKDNKKKLLIKNLTKDITHKDLENYFMNWGELERCYVAYNPQNGEHKGFGFLIFKNFKDAKKVLAYKNHNVNGVMVQASKNMSKAEVDDYQMKNNMKKCMDMFNDGMKSVCTNVYGNANGNSSSLMYSSDTRSEHDRIMLQRQQQIEMQQQQIEMHQQQQQIEMQQQLLLKQQQQQIIAQQFSCQQLQENQQRAQQKLTEQNQGISQRYHQNLSQRQNLTNHGQTPVQGHFRQGYQQMPMQYQPQQAQYMPPAPLHEQYMHSTQSVNKQQFGHYPSQQGYHERCPQYSHGQYEDYDYYGQHNVEPYHGQPRPMQPQGYDSYYGYNNSETKQGMSQYDYNNNNYYNDQEQTDNNHYYNQGNDYVDQKNNKYNIPGSYYGNDYYDSISQVYTGNSVTNTNNL